MILFTILAIVLLIVLMVAIFILGVGGSAFIVIFGDLIVCVVLIALIMKAIWKRKH